MKVREMAERTLAERWYPIAEAESIEEMRKIDVRTVCKFCEYYDRCSLCPLNGKKWCCNGHYNSWINAMSKNKLRKARKEALKIVKIIEKVRNQAKEN